MGQQHSRRSLPPAEEVEEAPYELRSIRYIGKNGHSVAFKYSAEIISTRRLFDVLQAVLATAAALSKTLSALL